MYLLFHGSCFHMGSKYQCAIGKFLSPDDRVVSGLANEHHRHRICSRTIDQCTDSEPAPAPYPFDTRAEDLWRASRFAVSLHYSCHGRSTHDILSARIADGPDLGRGHRTDHGNYSAEGHLPSNVSCEECLGRDKSAL